TSSVWAFDTNNLIVASTDAYYRPMFIGLFAINYSIFGTAAWGWHLVNVLIHVAVTAMIYFTLTELAVRKSTAAIAASLFAVHPAHVESVAWISVITDPLMALFVLPIFYWYLKFRKTRQKRYAAAALAMFLPALLCKETAVALPLIIAYCEIFYFADESPLK